MKSNMLTLSRSIGMRRTHVGLGVDTTLAKCPPGMTLDEYCNAVGKAVVEASKSQKTEQVYAILFVKWMFLEQVQYWHFPEQCMELLIVILMLSSQHSSNVL